MPVRCGVVRDCYRTDSIAHFYFHVGEDLVGSEQYKDELAHLRRFVWQSICISHLFRYVEVGRQEGARRLF